MAEKPVDQSDKCKLCNGAAKCWEDHPGFNRFNCQCARCGNYSIMGPLATTVLPTFADRYYLLAGCIRERTEHGQAQVQLTQEIIDDMLALAPRTVLQKAEKLLGSLARKSRYPGDWVHLTWRDSVPLGYCKNEEELHYYLEHLRVRRLIDTQNTAHDAACRVQPDGWTALESRRPSNLVSDKAFVAMWFDESMRLAYEEGIRPAVKEAGYQAVRIDAVEFNSDVVERIIGEIRECRFVVADVTGQRNGVYFEGGFAFGLALPVIWMCRDNEVEKLHFDTRQLNHIVWRDSATIRERLSRRILATMGPGPGRQLGTQA
jgi:nucleoside 2-deoxyribosyltransferase